VLNAPLRAAVLGYADAPAVAGLSRGVLDMLALAEGIRGRPEIRDVVHIGIGGSSLGPELAYQALSEFKDFAGRVHFVSNIDGHQLSAVLAGLVSAVIF
jgi:glucose-6-phosphate isomerase